MPRIFVTLFILLIFNLPADYGHSQDDSDYESRIQKLEEENQELRDILQQMQKRLDKLEGQKKPVKVESPKTKTKPEEESIEKRLNEHGEAIQKLEDDVDDDWIPSIEGEAFRLGGRLQAGFFNPGSGEPFASSMADRPGGSFYLDELRVYLDADFANKIRLYSSFDVEPDDTGLVKAFMAFEELPLQSEMTLGLKNRFYRPDRFTEYFPLPGLAFWRRRDLGINWKGDYEPFTAYVSLTNGLPLDDDTPGKDDSNFILGEDDDNPIDINDEKEISGGLGFEWEFEDFGEIQLLGFAVAGELSDEDVDFLLRRVPNYPITLDDTKERFGLNLDYKIGEWDFMGQYITAKDGEMDRDGWYAEASYKFEFDDAEYIQDIRPLVRYSVLDIANIRPDPFAQFASLGWDRRQWLFALITEITKNVQLNLEYQLNEEDTGGQDVNNNEFLVQMEVRF